MTIMRNEDGFNSLRSDHPLASLDMTNPLKWAIFMEDFLAYDIGQAAGHPYTLTATNGVDTILGPTGVWTGTLAGADNDLIQLQLTEAPFQTNSKRLFFQARFNLNIAGGTIAQNELFVGLASEQVGTAFFAADGLSVTADDVMGFFQFDGTASMGAMMGEGDAQSVENGVLTLTDATWVTVSIVYDGTEAKFYAGTDADGTDQSLVATISGNDATSVLTPTIYLKAGEAQGNILSCDYIYVAAER